MHRAILSAAILWAFAAAAQTERPPGLEEAEPETPPTMIPEIPAEHEDPMNREPDPAKGTPAAEGEPQPDAAAEHEAECDEREAVLTDPARFCPDEPSPDS